MDDFWIRLYQRDEDRSKFSISPCELSSDGGENELEVPPVLEVSRTEEGSAKSSVGESPFRDCPSDGALPRPRESIQPVDRWLVKVVCPEFDLVQNGSAGSPETTAVATVSILGLLCTTKVIEDNRFSCQRESC